MIERTLILIKPDGVERGLIGEVISRFEKAGLKVVGMKMTLVDEEFAKKHYTEDIAKRRGEKVRNALLKFIVSGPVVAMVLEGIEAVEVVRKITGETEPKEAIPGTIRGDYAHASFKFVDKLDQAMRNIVHSSGNSKEAKDEVHLWFSEDELYDYKTVFEKHMLHE